MKKKTPKAPRRQRNPRTPNVPPLAAMIATFCDPGCPVLPEHFVRAWAAAPRIAEQLRNNQDSGEPRYEYVTAQAEAAIDKARERAGSDHGSKLLTQAVDLLDEANADLRHTLCSEYSEPAYSIGLALGIYLATNGGAR